MKQSQDPFEAAFVEQEESPPESPSAANDMEAQLDEAFANDANQPEEEGGMDIVVHPNVPSTSAAPPASARINQPSNKSKEEEEEDEDDMEVELGKLPSTGDPDKMAKMQYVTFNAFQTYYLHVLPFSNISFDINFDCV